jgi:hypothetical protein
MINILQGQVVKEELPGYLSLGFSFSFDLAA